MLPARSPSPPPPPPLPRLGGSMTKGPMSHYDEMQARIRGRRVAADYLTLERGGARGGRASVAAAASGTKWPWVAKGWGRASHGQAHGHLMGTSDLARPPSRVSIIP